MSPPSLTTLADVSDFLAREILPQVAPESAGELRAALKLLDDLAGDLNEAYGALRDECVALRALCQEACGVCAALLPGSAPRLQAEVSALEQRQSVLRVDLNTAEEHYAQWAACLAGIIVVLQHGVDESGDDDARIRALLQRCYAVLGQQAARRAQWQSVF